MGQPFDVNTAAKTWRTMIESSQALLLQKSGHDAVWWAEQCRAAGLADDAGVRAWLRDRHGITGYAQYAVSWEMFGYPDYMLRGADELLEAQYAGHPGLQAIADSLLAWAAETDGVQIQLRKGYVSLHSTRRKFAQITRANSSCVDVALRIGGPAEGLLEAVNARAGDPFTRRIRLRAGLAVSGAVLDLLARALHENS